ncbi:MAG TPA: IclR family transcriptional regulator C-terminal domain-containing protein [Burkholderiales bacterium]|jgi:IclR family pca regulon transcriptional regulator
MNLDVALHANKPNQIKPPPSDSYVQSFARGLGVIRAFTAEKPSQTLTEVAARTGLDRAGARRILLTLAQLGYVYQEGRQFRLTARTLDLGYAYLSTTPLWNLAEPIMEELVAEVHESCSVAVLDGTEMVYILRVPTSKIMSINLGIGSRLPSWCTSMGRVLLSGLPDARVEEVLAASDIRAHTRHTVTDVAELQRIVAEARRQGYAANSQELEEGLCSIAVPLTDRAGNVIAAMNISGNASRVSVSQMTRKILPRLQAAAERINHALRLRA